MANWISKRLPGDAAGPGCHLQYRAGQERLQPPPPPHPSCTAQPSENPVFKYIFSWVVALINVLHMEIHQKEASESVVCSGVRGSRGKPVIQEQPVNIARGK